MKNSGKTLLALAFFIAIFGTNSASAAKGDRYAAVSLSTEQTAFLVDTQSVSGNTAWIITVSPISEYDESDKFFYNITYKRTQFDCANRKTKTLAMDQRDANDKSLWSKDNLNWDWSFVKPDTAYEGVLNFMCNKNSISDNMYWNSPKDLLINLQQTLREDLSRK
ncbi:surface-adhesin E family protein [Caulobacter sp.]|uniref:surface-adhesin E family protein n=1 Tax=Caulobacter sp. TaxID=78 RepID=UPI003BA8D7DA